MPHSVLCGTGDGGGGVTVDLHGARTADLITSDRFSAFR